MTHTLDDIEQRRNELDVKKTHLSLAVGYSHVNGYSTAVQKGYISAEKTEMAMQALEFIEENGYIPLPEELK